MNPRIKQLAEQAGFELQTNCGPLEGEGEIYYSKEFEKFAELVARDYATKLVQAHMNDPEYACAMDAYYEQKWAHRFD